MMTVDGFMVKVENEKGHYLLDSAVSSQKKKVKPLWNNSIIFLATIFCGYCLSF